VGDQAAPETFTRLGDRTWVWLGDLGRHEQTNVGVVVEEHGLVVVDANFPWAAERLVPAMTSTFGLGISHVANTHFHVDHSLGNEVFARAGATVVGAAGQRRELLERGPADAVVQVGELPDAFWPPAMEVSGILSFPSSSLELRSLPPAHTASDLIAWVPADAVLFVGDLAVDWDHGNNFSDEAADIDGWLRALELCLALEPRVVVPAHGRLGGPEVLERQHAFVRALWPAAQQAAALGQDQVDDVVRRHVLREHRRLAVDDATLAEMAGSLVAAARRRPSG
jgi:cyclase